MVRDSGGSEPNPGAHRRASGRLMGFRNLLQHFITLGVGEGFADECELVIVDLDFGRTHDELDDSARRGGPSLSLCDRDGVS